MNNSHVWRGLAIFLLVIGAATAISYGAYNEGVAQGIAQSGAIAAAASAGPPHAYGWHRPWGGGFFPLFSLLFFFVFFAAMRGFFWRGRGGWGHYHRDGVPPMFDEWHRRAHAQTPSPRSTDGAA